MTAYLTRDAALSGAQAGARRIPSPLEVMAQQALALQSQANALVATVLAYLDAQQPRAEDAPAMPPTFGRRPDDPPHAPHTALSEDAP